MRTIPIIALLALLPAFHATATEGPPAPAPDRAANDVSLIAAWIMGSDDAKAFDHPFMDRHLLGGGKQAILYCEPDGVVVPPGLKRVPYDFVKARMEKIRGGHKVDPAVLITRSIADEPEDRGVGRRVHIAKPGERIYYVEVAIGNMAWHWTKIAVYDVDGKPSVQFLWSAVS